MTTLAATGRKGCESNVKSFVPLASSGEAFGIDIGLKIVVERSTIGQAFDKAFGELSRSNTVRPRQPGSSRVQYGSEYFVVSTSGGSLNVQQWSCILIMPGSL